MKLRGDDPTAMKDFILGVQNKVNELKSLSGSIPDGQPKINNKRVFSFFFLLRFVFIRFLVPVILFDLSMQMEFMLETICDIKNNKKRLKEDPAPHTRLKKWLQKVFHTTFLLL